MYKCLFYSDVLYSRNTAAVRVGETGASCNKNNTFQDYGCKDLGLDAFKCHF